MYKLLAMLAAYFFSTLSAFADCFQIDYTKITDTISYEENKKEHHEDNVSLVLGINKLFVETISNKTIIDLEREQFIALDKKNKSYVIYSLYALPTFKLMEIKNRELLREVHKTIKLKETTDRIFDLEMEFGIKSNFPLEEKIIFETKDNTLIAKYAGKIVTQVKFSDADVLAKHKNMFEKYFLYTCELQPDIRKKILDKGKLLQELSYTTNSLSQTVTIKYIMKAAQSIKDISFEVPQDYEQVYSEDERVGNLITRLQDKSKMTTREQYEAKISKLLNSERILEAILIFSESNLQYGTFAKQLKDPRIKNLQGQDLTNIANISVAKPKSVKEVDALFESVKNTIDKKLDGHEVLYINLSNFYYDVGALSQAKTFMYKALDINPFITGALVDLGKIYYLGYDVPVTFMLCDQAMKIAPNHSLLEWCSKLKNVTKNRLPEYFS